MARRAVLGLLALAQFASIAPGTRSPGAAASLTASLLGIAAGVALFIWPRRTSTPAVVGGLYAVQAGLVGPVLPVVAVASVLLATAQPAQPATTRDQIRRFGPTAAAIVAVVITAAVTGSPATALSYAVALLVAVVVGLVIAARATRLETQRRELVAAERLRLARDLHDVVGHGLTAISVQAGTGRVALDSGAYDAARESLAAVETAARGALREIRWLVSLQREDETRPGLNDVPSLVDGARRCGADVTFADPTPDVVLSPEVHEAAYRIVQESLTNVLRHAPTSTTTIHIRSDNRHVVIDVTNTGDLGMSHGDGVGIKGMRERAAAVGGTLDAGPHPEGTAWTVRAELPAGSRR